MNASWSATVATCTILTIAIPALAQTRDAQPVQLSKVADSMYEVLGGHGARGGAYLTPAGVLLIDAKMDKADVEQALAEVRKLSDQPVRYVVSTHSDGDHVKGNAFMPATAVFIAHENCRKEMLGVTREGKPSEWLAPEMQPYVPSLTFNDKMEIHLGGRRVELWYFGVGHTTGDTVVYFPEEKVAFLGDQLFTSRPQLIHAYKGGSSFEHVATLEKMLARLDAQVFCSGHSEPTDRDGVLRHVAEIKAMQEKVRELAGAGKSVEEVRQAFKADESALVTVIYAEIEK